MATYRQSNKQVVINEVSWNVARARYANFSIFTDYDTASASIPKPNDAVVLTIKGTTIFNGWVLNRRRLLDPNGGEEIIYEAADGRHFLNKLTYEKDGAINVVYNDLANELTVGQVFAEIASAIPNQYVKSYSNSEVLAMTTKAGRFEISNEPFSSILQRLVELAGDYVWYIDVNRRLRVVNRNSLTARNVYIGETGEAVSAHSEYEVKSHEIQEDVTNAYSRVKIISERSDDEDFDFDIPVFDEDGNDVTSERLTTREFRCMPAWNPDDEPEPFDVVFGTGNPDVAAAEHFRQVLGQSRRRDVFRKFIVRIPRNLSLVTSPYFRLGRWEYDRDEMTLGTDPDIADVLTPWVRAFRTHDISASFEHNPIHNTMVITLDQPEHAMYLSGFYQGELSEQQLQFDIFLQTDAARVVNDREVKLVYKVVAPSLRCIIGAEPNRSRLGSGSYVSGVVTSENADNAGSVKELPKLTAEVGPEGTAYTQFGLDRTLYMLESNIQDVTELESRAQARLDKVKDVRYNGQLTLKGLVTDVDLHHGINVHNANPAWASLKIPVYGVSIRPQSDETLVELTSDYYPV